MISSVESGDNKSPFIPKIDFAQEYVIIKKFEYATPPDKKGLEVTIYSKKSITFEQRAQTAINAAINILKDEDLYEVIIKMSASSNIKKFNLLAYVEYTPHKKNTWGMNTNHTWSVKASDDIIKNGQLIEKGKVYPLSYIYLKKYLKK